MAALATGATVELESMIMELEARRKLCSKRLRAILNADNYVGLINEYFPRIYGPAVCVDTVDDKITFEICNETSTHSGDWTIEERVLDLIRVVHPYIVCDDADGFTSTNGKTFTYSQVTKEEYDACSKAASARHADTVHDDDASDGDARDEPVPAVPESVLQSDGFMSDWLYFRYLIRSDLDGARDKYRRAMRPFSVPMPADWEIQAAWHEMPATEVAELHEEPMIRNEEFQRQKRGPATFLQEDTPN